MTLPSCEWQQPESGSESRSNGFPRLSFRYERQQGRLREHIQFNADILGSDLSADAELITLLVHSLRDWASQRRISS